MINTSDSERKNYNGKLKKKIEFLPNSANAGIILELYIVLAGGCSWHPCCNWNLLYDITLIDVNNRRLKIIKKTKWKQDIDDEE